MNKEDKISGYLQGSLSQVERDEFLQWLATSQENKREYFRQKDIWDAYQQENKAHLIDLSRERSVLNQRIDVIDDAATQGLHKPWRFWAKIAATILLAFGLGWGVNTVANLVMGQGEMAFNEVKVIRGQVSELRIADGSVLSVNSDTRLHYAVDKRQSERIVKLEGEAFFEVKKDVERPFIVYAKGLKLKVLGTKFNVKAYPNENKVYATLESGSLQASTKGQSIIMKPGEQLEINTTTKKMVVRHVDAGYYSAWKTGRYVFKNEEFRSIVRMMERWYDVKMEYPEGYFDGMKYSGVIKKVNSVEHVLKLIDYTTPIDYKIGMEKITIQPKKGRQK